MKKPVKTAKGKMPFGGKGAVPFAPKNGKAAPDAVNPFAKGAPAKGKKK